MSSASLVQPCEACNCAAAREQLRKLSGIQFDTQFADAPYTDEDHRPAIPGYDPVTGADELAKIGLEPSDLVIPGKNFRTVVYRTISPSGSPSYVVAFQGTNWHSLSDWGANISQALGLSKGSGAQNSYYSRAQQIAVNIQRKLGGHPPPVRFVGHSLGGGLASAAATVIGAPATTFNTAGLNPKTVSDPQPGAMITAVSVKGEILTTAQAISPLPKAVGKEFIALDPPISLARDILPVIGVVQGLAGVTGGLLVRSVMLHLMGSVHGSVDAAVAKAENLVREKCGP